jgi:flagellar biosynthesis chaperone FliJ
MLDKHPSAADRVLFEMGIIHAHPKNEQKDYGKALECFDKVITAYPESSYRKDSEMMTFYISNGIVKDNVISAKQSQIEALRQELKERDHEIAGLHAQIEALEQKFFAFAAQAGPVDKILIEKKSPATDANLEGRGDQNVPDRPWRQSGRPERTARRPQDPGRNLLHRCKKQEQPIPPVAAHFLSKRSG